jgi:hypothetical protein
MAIKKYILICFCIATTCVNAQQKNFINRTLDWGYNLVQGDSAHPKKKYFFVVPIVSYKPETRWMAGLSFAHYFRSGNNDSITRPSVIRFNTTYTQNHQWGVRPEFEVFSEGNKYNVRGMLQFTKFTENYWGIGNNTPASNKELYDFNQIQAQAKVTQLIGKQVYIGLKVNYEQLFNIAPSPTGIIVQSTITGTKGFHSLGVGPLISIDNRDQIYFPKKGHFIDISALFYGKELGSTSSFSNLLIDARKYIGLWKENVLAIQAYANLNEGNVPYRLMGSIGSDKYMRGYYSGRFRDKHAIAFQAELRKHVWGPLGLVFFGGAGNVGYNISNLSNNIKPMYGAGIRFLAIPREKINMRLDYGRGIDGIEGFYITLNEAF